MAGYSWELGSLDTICIYQCALLCFSLCLTHTKGQEHVWHCTCGGSCSGGEQGQVRRRGIGDCEMGQPSKAAVENRRKLVRIAGEGKRAETEPGL